MWLRRLQNLWGRATGASSFEEVISTQLHWSGYLGGEGRKYCHGVKLQLMLKAVAIYNLAYDLLKITLASLGGASQWLEERSNI